MKRIRIMLKINIILMIVFLLNFQKIHHFYPQKIHKLQSKIFLIVPIQIFVTFYSKVNS